jgi:hypothetical protein
VSVDGGYPIRQILVALVVLTALYLDFNIYQTGNVWVAVAGCDRSGRFCLPFRRRIHVSVPFPGFFGIRPFRDFPIIYMVFLSFTKYSSQNLLSFDRSLALLRQEEFFGWQHFLQV